MGGGHVSEQQTIAILASMRTVPEVTPAALADSGFLSRSAQCSILGCTAAASSTSHSLEWAPLQRERRGDGACSLFGRSTWMFLEGQPGQYLRYKRGICHIACIVQVAGSRSSLLSACTPARHVTFLLGAYKAAPAEQTHNLATDAVALILTSIVLATCS